MNLNQVLTEIEKIDPEVYDRLDSRRNTVKQFTKVGGRVALTAVPLLLGGMFKKAYAGSSAMPSIVEVLNFALTLEYLESSYYNTALGTAGLIPSGSATMGFEEIAAHENEHVAFLASVITSLNGTPVSGLMFDYTAGGLFPDVLSNYDTFLAVSQTFEDTGVRAYKGQAGNLKSDNTILTAALQIHSVEARHASHVREIRSMRANDESIRPWITGESTSSIGSLVQPNYAGEGNCVQLGIEIQNINGFDISYEDATEAFDEILTMDQVLALVDPFIV